MIWSHLIGQKLLKKQMEYLLLSDQVPHAQLFSGLPGYGALPLAIEFSLGLLGCERNEKEHKSLSELCQNPDLHFVIPVVKKIGEKTAFSDNYSKEWLSFLDENPYGNYSAWFKSISVGNKQGMIGIDDIKRIHKKMFLKSYAGQKKACIIWGAEKMNSQAANAFLKILEEPPRGTFFFLIAEDTEMILPTIMSRCQHVCLSRIDDEAIKDSIQDKKIDYKEIVFRADGDYNRMKDLLREDDNIKYEKLIVEGLRLAFKAKGNQKIIGDLMNWSDNLSSLGREDQKEFIAYSIQFFRDAFLLNYKLDSLISFRSSIGFDIHKLAPYISPGNILELIDLFEKNHFYVTRNANSKMIFSNLSLKLAQLMNIRKD
tara:strand:- start:1635 stop:2750 length:1116 start_codon:yes stop_codon:yes gene_type:complete